MSKHFVDCTNPADCDCNERMRSMQGLAVYSPINRVTDLEAQLTAAQAEIARLREALRSVVVEENDDFYRWSMCGLCGGIWDLGGPENHKPDCPARLP